MSERIKLKINDREIEVAKGTLLIEAAKHAGAEIPHFCYHPKLKPDANCRMCLVEIEKMPKLQTSCSTLVAEGMVVQTASEKVKEAQDGVMAFLLGNHPLDCPECDQGGECQLQDFAHEFSPTTSRFVEEKREFKKEYFGPLIEKEMNRCVSCLRCVRYCDEVIGSNALGSMDRGSHHEIGAFARQELECEYCGGCIQICPVGALTSRLSMFDYRTWQLKKTETICNYCGSGCTLTLEAAKDEITRVSSETGVGRNEGDLCALGFFGYGSINHEDRLKRPSLRVNGQMMEVTWEWAFEKAAKGLQEIVGKSGPQAVGGIITAHCTNEEVYLFQKLMREVIGTPHVDSEARYGYINAVRGLNEVFGTARLVRYEELIEADCILAFAGEMAETNAVTALKVKEAVNTKGAKLITVAAYTSRRETYISHLPNIAKQHLALRFGTEGAAIIGLTKALMEAGPASSAPENLLKKIRLSIETISFEALEAVTGISEAAYREAGALYAGAKHGVMIFGRAILRSTDGYQNVLRLAELAIIAGQVGRPGTGILPLAKEGNAFGAIEMGGVSEYLPGLEPVTQQGHTVLEMLDAAERGEIKALYLVGENPLRAFPQKKVKAALEKVELLICQDLFPTETTALADVLLPGTSYAEKSGHFTNHEGEIQKVRQAIEPVGNSKPDWQIFSIIANKMKAAARTPYQQLLGYKSADAVWKEVVMSLPNTWPKTSDQGISEQIQFYSGKAQITYVLPEPVAKNGDFGLQLGESLFHSGKMSTYASGLTILLDKEVAAIHPDDAERLEIEEGEMIEVTGAAGIAPIQLPVRFSKKIGIGTLFIPEHFDLPVKALLPLTVDPTTGVPYGDRGRVTLSKVPVAVQ